jgi:amino acid adenylation domain-containing protein
VHLAALVEAQVARTPDRPALRAAGHTLTYAELNVRANRLAHHLIRRRIGPESLVAVALPRSADLVVAALAVLKAGGAYVPMDTRSAPRIAGMLDDAQPAVLVTSTGTAVDRIPAGGWSGETVPLDDSQTAAVIAAGPSTDPTDRDRTVPLSPLNPAYVIYTSGSTGKPKGVVVEHQSVVHYLLWTTRTYPGARGVAVVPTSLAFDLTVTGLYTPLAVGGCVHLVSLPGYDPADVVWLRDNPCTFLKATPSHLPLLESLPPDLSPRTDLLLGGEALLGASLARWRQRHPAVTVRNVYGPTEATVNCAEHRIAPDAEIAPGPVPIGRPQAGRLLYVLDRQWRPAPPGEVGELYVGGDGLARGYLGRPSATAERFLPDPYGPPGARMYRTGDLVRADENGALTFVGRADSQVKLRGHRIELAEVDAVLAERAELAQVVCAVRGRPPDDRLVAYAVARPGHTVDPEQVRRHAAARLPGHMVPSAVVVLPRLPLTPNGKLSRDGLARIPDDSAPAADPFQVVLPLRLSGDRSPLFCVAPAVGVAWGYRELLDHVADRPVYGLQAPWLSRPEDRPETVAELACALVARLRDVQPTGPYRLLGASFGGLVAHAIATRLQDAGEVVSLLAVLGAYPDGDAEATVEQRRAQLARAIGGGQSGSTRVDGVLAIAGVLRDCARLAGTFAPGRFDGDLLCFPVADDTMAARAAQAWQPYVAGQVTAHAIQCGPAGPVTPEGLAQVGPVLAERLDGTST